MSWHGNGYRNGLSSGSCEDRHLGGSHSRCPDQCDCRARRALGTPRTLAGAPTLARGAVCGLSLVAALAGCAMSPAVTKSGLPRVTRYAGPAQLDWMLGRYQAIGQA